MRRNSRRWDGLRCAESNVRAAAFGGPGFSWPDYISKSNEESLIIPMAEDFEFADNVEEILSVDGLDAINFGPIDYSLSANLPIGYKIDHPSLIEGLPENRDPYPGQGHRHHVSGGSGHPGKRSRHDRQGRGHADSGQ